MVFPGAVASRDDAAYVILGAPLDVSTTFQPGCRFGPREIRFFAEALENYDHHTDQLFSECNVHDLGDIRAWDDAEEYLEYITGEVTDIARSDAVPILLGGEHTVTVAGVRAVDPDVVVCLDAHLDLRREFDGNELSHATTLHHALGVVDELVILGARSGSDAEWDRATEPDVQVVEPGDVPGWTPEFSDDVSVYLSVDIDAADPSVAPGTGTLVPGGLSAREMQRVVRTVAPFANGVDVMEVNDRDNGQAAVLGAKLVREVVYGHAAHHAR